MTATAEARVPPHNREAEESVLGAMLLNKGAIERTLDTGLAAPDFYRDSHATIFKAMCRLYDQDQPVDALTVADVLEKDGTLDKIGGAGRIVELAALVPATANVAHYAGIVREKAAYRRLTKAGSRIADLGWEGRLEIDDCLAQAEAELSKAVTPTITTQFSPLADDLDELIAQIEEATRTGTPKMGLRTGFLDLDRILTGLHPGQLILVAARPSMGKSALAQNIAENVADAGVPAAILSLEMSRKEVLLRSLARASRIDSNSLKTGTLRQEELPKLKTGKDALAARRDLLFVEDHPGVTAQKLRAEARRLHRQKKIGVLVVDYLQLMLSELRDDNRQIEISNISRSLKLLARELEIPVVALSQLNRNLEIRSDKRPQLSDLRDSGALEQDADVVLFVYRDEYYHPDSTDLGIAEIIIGKNRNGGAGTVKLAFVGRHTEFKNLAREGGQPT